ncbi:MAG: oligosaccharide flippase family protein [Flavobacteriales bacterium]
MKTAFLKYFGLNPAESQHVRVAGNVWALLLLQLTNYILPLVLLPILIVRLNVENYGILAFGLYTIQYLITLSDYGFFFSATRQVSLIQNKPESLSEIFWSVQYSRFLLSLVGFFLLMFFIATVRLDENERSVLMLLFISVIGNVFSPQWLFQGMERMKWITIVQLASKLLLLVGVLVYVKGPEDLPAAAFLHGSTQLFAGIASMVLAIRIFKVRIIIPHAKSVWYQLKDGWHIFITTFYTTLYVNTNGFLLKFITGNNEWVGYYQAGEKVVRAVASLFNPFMTALFPYISRKIEENRQEGVKLFFQLLNRLSILTFISMVLLWIFAPWISHILLQQASPEVVSIIQILAVVVFFGTAGSMLSLQLFLNIGWKSKLPYLLFLLAVLDILMCFWLIPHSGHNGAALALAVTEVLAPVIYIGLFKLRYPKP